MKRLSITPEVFIHNFFSMDIFENFPMYLLILLGLLFATTAYAVNYDIVYVRAPRYGDTNNTNWPEVKDPTQMEPGTDLMLLHTDGTEEVLVDAGDVGAAIDPFVSFDGKWVYYAFCPNVKDVTSQRRASAMRQGCDIYKINVATREKVRLTFQEFTPNTGVTKWCEDFAGTGSSECTALGYGIFNLGPAPLPGGKVIFTSSRNGFLPNKTYTFPNLQLFVLDEITGNIEQIGHLNVGSSLHPTPLMNGQVMFSSYESQGLRDKRMWGLWSIWPDGRQWKPLLSAFLPPFSAHFQTQLSDGSIVVGIYYNQNNNGFGTFLKFNPSDVTPGEPAFGSPDRNLNPAIAWGCARASTTRRQAKFPFQPIGLQTLLEFANANDEAGCVDEDGMTWLGKATHPSAAPDNDLLLVWTPGPANNLLRPTNVPYYDGGIYVLKGGTPIAHPSQLMLVKNDPAYNEQQPRALVSYRTIYGIDEPATLPWLTTDQRLMPGEPFGLVGTSSLIKRDTDGANPKSNWLWQGANAGAYTDDDIYAIRILAMEPTSHLSYGLKAFGNKKESWFDNLPNGNYSAERLRILGEIPVRKTDDAGAPILDPEGNPDTSFLVKIPADVPFTFQTLDRHGMVLNMAQTWHQVRPGEVRNDCGGCHAHAHKPLAFEGTAASKPDYIVQDLAEITPLLTPEGTVEQHTSGAVDIEFKRDIQPILAKTTLSGETYDNLASKFNSFQSRISQLITEIKDQISSAELMTIARWIDLGAPIDTGGGWFVDDLRPTLHVKLDSNVVHIGAFDYYSGLDPNSLQVMIDGQDVTANLKKSGGFVWEMSLSGTEKELVASVSDNQGNQTVRKVAFVKQPGDTIPPQAPSGLKIVVIQ
jgi:hypothetical protein